MLGLGTELRIPSIKLCSPIIELCIPSNELRIPSMPMKVYSVSKYLGKLHTSMLDLWIWLCSFPVWLLLEANQLHFPLHIGPFKHPWGSVGPPIVGILAGTGDQRNFSWGHQAHCSNAGDSFNPVAI